MHIYVLFVIKFGKLMKKNKIEQFKVYVYSIIMSVKSDSDADIDELDPSDDEKDDDLSTKKIKPQLVYDSDASKSFDEESGDELDLKSDDEVAFQVSDTVKDDLAPLAIDSKQISPVGSDVESDDEDEFKRFSTALSRDHIKNSHPECIINNSEEIELRSKIIRDENGFINDKYHMTVPILTKYEKTRILGLRTMQLNKGASPLIDIPNTVIEGYDIAIMELSAKKIPFVIRRPLPNNTCEYWKVKDLEVLE